jgi:predicted kinase
MTPSTTDRTPWVVVVCGPSGGGKSSLARPLAEQLGLLLLSKDEIKEILFDSLGWGDRERSRALSDAAYGLMFHLLEKELAAGRSAMLEANFRPEAAQRLARILENSPYRAIQIRCTADRQVLMDRLTHRAEQKLRHPGHLDAALLPEAAKLIENGFVELPGPVLEVDSTDPEKVEPSLIAQRVAELMANA